MIGKTRQDTRHLTHFDAGAGPARGILRTDLAPGTFSHSRKSPAAELNPWILHYWMVQWDLEQGRVQTVETLPHPNVQLVFSSQDGSALVHGVHTGKFSRQLQGRARVFGVKFRAGGFFPFLQAPVSSLRGKTIPATRVFGEDLAPLHSILASESSEQDKLDHANEFFSRLAPKTDADADSAAKLVDSILNDPGIRSVAELSSRSGLSIRSLQRLFYQYVGVSPKWVIRRYRLHELVEQLNSGKRRDWATVAAELGYFDQSHLIRDFRRLTGWSPEEYRLTLIQEMEKA
ncbi:MAG: DUF6597 domain-containing transcriptional factor [Bryobacteraceae bacterium]